ncbi:uncharacterized protein LOC120470501 [Pimephales promelas]|uniref:uncharacterized protein LOC120470501 n=1 Tax=Pimephales promelas TaxID=90988 RepID=UPI001955DF6D|nr:uncharacterized protein LOC120470501 [Pimephales promelas]
MGTSYSQEDIERFALEMYNDILWQTPCLLPDVGIDESLLKYSGDDSNAVLQSYSDGMLDSMPGYVSGFGSAFGNLKSVPNAVGLGALVISMIIEIIIKSSTQTSDKTDTYSLLRRVFGEEKASSVRDIMTEYLKRHRMFMTNDQLLREDIKRLEKQLSQHLTILRNSLLQDGQMSSRGLKIWVNGAAFHVQMLIHEVRLGVKADKTVSDCVFVINAAIDVYSQSLDLLLEKYKPYKINSNMWKVESYPYIGDGFVDLDKCLMYNDEIEGCKTSLRNKDHWLCGVKKRIMASFMDIVFSKYEPIIGLKRYFSNVKNNLNSLIHERGSFAVPSAAG